MRGTRGTSMAALYGLFLSFFRHVISFSLIAPAPYECNACSLSTFPSSTACKYRDTFLTWSASDSVMASASSERTHAAEPANAWAVNKQGIDCEIPGIFRVFHSFIDSENRHEAK
ncbi:hypothetical protein L210DRAFT_2080818 [Boletus edulis BED1]|uniref:Secreted protein n=1 Tax=Boletus edulis BED1 TaxID=1328754 RepID=A0AAD4BWI8_BOLED|nr:hypothetical protein L210DRAFT_2080818 [Boletus edulis BED1]